MQTLVKILFLTLTMFWIVGCTQEPSGSEYLYFGWIPDGSGLVALKNNNDETKTEVCVYNQKGELLKQYRLGLYIPRPVYDDRLLSSNRLGTFYLESGDCLFLVNYTTEENTLLLKGEYFIGASPSGNRIMTWRSLADSMEFKIYTLHNGEILSYVSKRYHEDVNFRPYSGFSDRTFLNDSLWVACYSDSGGCNLTMFNDDFGIVSPIIDSLGGSFSRFASNINKLFYTASDAIKYFDLNTNQTDYITYERPYTASFGVDLNGKYCIYSVNEEKRYGIRPGTLKLYSFEKRSETTIASGIVSGGQVSPDGKSVAYFTNENKDIHPHIYTIP